MVKKYDYLIVGAGLFGSTFANLAHRRGKRCLVIDKRPHLGGNVYCENVDGITIHKYGPHIFHTSDKKVWDYVNSFVPFNQFTLNIVAISNGKLYNLPFNMNLQMDEFKFNRAASDLYSRLMSIKTEL